MNKLYERDFLRKVADRLRNAIGRGDPNAAGNAVHKALAPSPDKQPWAKIPGAVVRVSHKNLSAIKPTMPPEAKEPPKAPRYLLPGDIDPSTIKSGTKKPVSVAAPTAVAAPAKSRQIQTPAERKAEQDKTIGDFFAKPIRTMSTTRAYSSRTGDAEPQQTSAAPPASGINIKGSGPSTRLNWYSAASHKQWKPGPTSRNSKILGKDFAASVSTPALRKVNGKYSHYLAPIGLNTPGIHPHEVSARKTVIGRVNTGIEAHNKGREDIAAAKGLTKAGKPFKATAKKKPLEESATLTTIRNLLAEREMLSERNWIKGAIHKNRAGMFAGETATDVKREKADYEKGNHHGHEARVKEGQFNLAIRAKEKGHL